MAGQTVALLGGALKRDYHGPIVDALNNMSVLYALLDKDEDVKVSGEGFSAYVPIKTRRNQGMGARAESAALPSARYVKTAQLVIPLAYNYGRQYCRIAKQFAMKHLSEFGEALFEGNTERSYRRNVCLA